MKRISLLVLLFANVLLFAQKTENVSVGAGYANDVYYSFANGVVKTEVRTNWHIGFTTKIVDAAIWTNEGLGVELFVASTDTSDWNTLDTTGMTWDLMHNSPNTWDEGSFNDGAVGHPDYGWGLYNNITHNVFGSKIFVMKLENGSYKKVMIQSMLTNGDFSFKIANLDGTSEVSKTVNKSSYNTKNLFYYDVINDVFVDREPVNADWDMLFTRYMEEIIPGTYYPVTGVYINPAVTGAKAEGVDTNTADWNNYTQTDSITIVGSNWKSFNNGTFQWVIADSLAYFITAQDGNMYKLIFKDFGGSSTGDITFATSIVSAIGINEDVLASSVMFYPNPANDILNVDVERNGKAELLSLTGARVVSKTLNAGINSLDVSSLATGVYVLRVYQNQQVSIFKVVVE